MKTSVYIVLESQGRWWIDLDGRTHGPFPSKDDALEGAQVLATTFDGAERAQIYAPGVDGRQHRFWPLTTVNSGLRTRVPSAG